MGRDPDIANKRILLDVHGSLVDFLDANEEPCRVPVYYSGAPSVKDIIESEGIPHVEVDLIAVNGRPVDFSYNVRPKDHIKIYPRIEETDFKYRHHLKKRFSRPYLFILDVHLGTLAKRLRLAGIDTSYDNHWEDPEIVKRASQERRIILTRDVDLLKRGEISCGYWVRSIDPDLQFKEVYETFNLEEQKKPFTRCLNCNGTLVKVEKDEVADRLPAKVRKDHEKFARCRGCGQIFWKGSHYKKLLEKLENVKN